MQGTSFTASGHLQEAGLRSYVSELCSMLAKKVMILPGAWVLSTPPENNGRHLAPYSRGKAWKKWPQGSGLSFFPLSLILSSYLLVCMRRNCSKHSCAVLWNARNSGNHSSLDGQCSLLGGEGGTSAPFFCCQTACTEDRKNTDSASKNGVNSSFSSSDLHYRSTKL